MQMQFDSSFQMGSCHKTGPKFVVWERVKRDRESTHNDARTGRPKSATTDAQHRTVMNDGGAHD